MDEMGIRVAADMHRAFTRWAEALTAKLDHYFKGTEENGDGDV